MRKRLKQLEKNTHIYEDLKLSDEEEPIELPTNPKKVLCPKCNEGELYVVMSLDDKDIVGCTSCHHRKSIKK